jgi:hypothetical protein
LSEIAVSPLGPVKEIYTANGGTATITSATVTAKCLRDYIFDIEASAFGCKKGAVVKIAVQLGLYRTSRGVWETGGIQFHEAFPDGKAPAEVPGPTLPRPTSQEPQTKEEVLRRLQEPGQKVIGLAMGTYASLAFVEISRNNIHLKLVAHDVVNLDCGTIQDSYYGRMVALSCPGITEVWVPPDAVGAEVYHLDGTAAAAQVQIKGPQRFYRVRPGDQAIVFVFR